VDRLPTRASSDVVNAQVTCGATGCFTFGPQQSYRPPAYRPSYLPPNAPPTYYRPRAVGVPPGSYYRLAPPKPAAPPPLNPQAVYRTPEGTYTAHDQWCFNRYRSFNPDTNRYKTIEGRYKLCHSPYGR